MKKARIISLGSYVPERVLTNHDLEKMVDTTDEWIYTRTGIRERRIAAKGESTSDLGVRAAERALERAQLKATDVDLILVATMTPDHLCPVTANLIQAKLQARSVPALDMLAACSGWLYGLSMAKAWIESGAYQRILLIATEKMSAFINFHDRSSCILFGDGAAAAVIAGEGAGLLIHEVDLGSDGAGADLIMIPAGGAKHPTTAETLAEGGHFLTLKGKEVFKYAVRQMAASAEECLKKAGLHHGDIRWFVPHQANGRIMEAMARQLEIDEERVYRTIEKYGNTSASSIGIALDELMQEGKLKEGEHLLLTAFGGGLTWGASILTRVGQ